MAQKFLLKANVNYAFFNMATHTKFSVTEESLKNPVFLSEAYPSGSFSDSDSISVEYVVDPDSLNVFQVLVFWHRGGSDNSFGLVRVYDHSLSLKENLRSEFFVWSPNA